MHTLITCCTVHSWFTVTESMSGASKTLVTHNGSLSIQKTFDFFFYDWINFSESMFVVACFCQWKKKYPRVRGGECLLILLFGCDYTLEWTPLISVWLVWLCCCLLYILYIVCRFFQFSDMVELFIFNLFVPLKKKNTSLFVFRYYFFNMFALYHSVSC